MPGTTKYPCACCGYLTISEEMAGSFEICPICFWEDDAVQFDDPDYRGGANRESLNEARENFKKFRACNEGSTGLVRPPQPDEIPPGGFEIT